MLVFSRFIVSAAYIYNLIQNLNESFITLNTGMNAGFKGGESVLSDIYIIGQTHFLNSGVHKSKYLFNKGVDSVNGNQTKGTTYLPVSYFYDFMSDHILGGHNDAKTQGWRDEPTAASRLNESQRKFLYIPPGSLGSYEDIVQSTATYKDKVNNPGLSSESGDFVYFKPYLTLSNGQPGSLPIKDMEKFLGDQAEPIRAKYSSDGGQTWDTRVGILDLLSELSNGRQLQESFIKMADIFNYVVQKLGYGGDWLDFCLDLRPEWLFRVQDISDAVVGGRKFQSLGSHRHWDAYAEFLSELGDATVSSSISGDDSSAGFFGSGVSTSDDPYGTAPVVDPVSDLGFDSAPDDSLGSESTSGVSDSPDHTDDFARMVAQADSMSRLSAQSSGSRPESGIDVPLAVDASESVFTADSASDLPPMSTATELPVEEQKALDGLVARGLVSESLSSVSSAQGMQDALSSVPRYTLDMRGVMDSSQVMGRITSFIYDTYLDGVSRFEEVRISSGVAQVDGVPVVAKEVLGLNDLQPVLAERIRRQHLISLSGGDLAEALFGYASTLIFDTWDDYETLFMPHFGFSDDDKVHVVFDGLPNLRVLVIAGKAVTRAEAREQRRAEFGFFRSSTVRTRALRSGQRATRGFTKRSWDGLTARGKQGFFRRGAAAVGVVGGLAAETVVGTARASRWSFGKLRDAARGWDG